MIEKDIEDYLCGCVVALGGEVRKVEWVGRKHAPDRRVMLRGHCFWAELKRPGGKPRPGQQREIERMRAQGETVHVLSEFEEIDQLLESYGFASPGV